MVSGVAGRDLHVHVYTVTCMFSAALLLPARNGLQGIGFICLSITSHLRSGFGSFFLDRNDFGEIPS